MTKVLKMFSELLGVLPKKIKSARDLITAAKERGQFFDASKGKQERSVILLHDGTVWLSALIPKILGERIEKASQRAALSANTEKDG